MDNVLRNRQYYIDNKAKIAERKRCRYLRIFARPGGPRNKAERYKVVNGLKNKPCMDCGGWFNPWQMEYDHRNPQDKFMNISAMVVQAYSMLEIYTEIEKCDLVCANCHQDRTHMQKRYVKVRAEALTL